MISFQFKHVCLETCGVYLPEQEVTSAELEDRLAPVYERLKIPFGTLEKLSGITSRRLFPPTTNPSEIGTRAAQEALADSHFTVDDIGAIFNCSVTRDYFEPATACIIHRNLKASESAMALDITNACIGFSNGLVLLSNLIETGVVKAGLLVAGENIARIIETSISYLLKNDNFGREDLLQTLPTFTLGCGGVAFLLCHDSVSKNKHHIVGSVSRSASEFSDLCAGNGDYYINQLSELNPLMRTESAKLMASAAKLGGRVWQDFSRVFAWSKDTVKHIFCHQVGRQVNEAFYQVMGLDYKKEFTVYKKLGNLVSAALPTAFALGIREKNINKGDKILFTAFGSGLNSIFTGIDW